jgi:hypothetical protein
VQIDTRTHDQTLVTAFGRALDRVEYHLRERDYLMADVAGAIIRKLLQHPAAGLLSLSLDWRRQYARWENLRTRLSAPPLMLADLVEHYASVALIEATREADRVAQ